MKNIAEARKAFEKLPPHITIAQITEATGYPYVHNWVRTDPSFPGEVDRKDGTVYRDRDAVLDWYAARHTQEPSKRRGPRRMEAQVLAARPTQVLMDSAELAELLDLTRRAVNKYAERYPSGTADDPFPLADADGKRSWSQLRAWFLRRSDPMPTAGESGAPDWADLRAWLLRHAEDGTEVVDGRVYLDELGLTTGQRDVVERARRTRAHQVRVPIEWLAEVLHLEEPGQAEWLDRLLSEPDTAPVAPSIEASANLAQEQRRLKPTALARELGLNIESVKHFARVYTAEKSEDPFPAKDSSSARDVAEVREWLIRNRKIRPAEAPAAGA
ncbi:hypothetical protein ACFWP7_22330 [Streptomyces sp. NPDC058470]|uniref:hypothetical protein n=1 Tax=Streptomyces sp. NPDC058470 TaxID=3346515 RepID=UPI003658DA46